MPVSSRVEIARWFLARQDKVSPPWDLCLKAVGCSGEEVIGRRRLGRLTIGLSLRDSHGVCIQDYPSQLSKPHKLLSGGPKGYKAVTWGVESDWRHYGPMRISAVSVRGHESHEECADL